MGTSGKNSSSEPASLPPALLSPTWFLSTVRDRWRRLGESTPRTPAPLPTLTLLSSQCDHTARPRSTQGHSQREQNRTQQSVTGALHYRPPGLRARTQAARFVREHCLKPGFEAPLAAYLLEAEGRAESIPARLEADLSGIRMRYRKR